MRKIVIVAAAAAIGLTPTVATAYPAGTAPVASLYETPGTGTAGDDADDPAIWVNQADPSQSLVIANGKKSRALFVYNLQGQLVQKVSDGKFYGNVDVRGDWVIAAHNGINMFRVQAGRLVEQRELKGNAVTSGEGLCLWQHDGQLYAVNDVKDTFRVRVQALTDGDGDGLLQVQKPIFDWTQPSEGESCVVDDATSTLYVSEEDHGIWKVDLLSPGPAPARTMFIPTSAHLTPDIEGLAIANGILYASAQNGIGKVSQANWIAQFDLATGQWLGDFRVEGSTSTDDCDQTDGIDITTTPLSSDFPAGLLVCQDGYNEAPGSSGTQDFKLVSLATVPQPPMGS